MAKVDIPYYVVVKGRGYWRPTARMRAQGFALIRCGPDGPAAWTIAAEWNLRWQRHRRGEPWTPQPAPTPQARAHLKTGPAAQEAGRRYPRGSLGDAFARFRATPEWANKAPRTREDWFRGWRHIQPVFGDCPPAALSLENLSAWRAAIEGHHGRREAHRATKIWRALWKVAAAMHYCRREDDPSLGVRNVAAKGRSSTWSEGEAVRLAKCAWRLGYRGLATAIAILWDSQLSPVDVRRLTAGQLKTAGRGAVIVNRQKSGAPAGGLLGRRTAALIAAYRQSLGFEPMEHIPLLRTRGLPMPTEKGGRPRQGQPYSSDTMGEEFRIIRELVFGGHERRQLQDFRRSGAVEAIAGGASAEALAHGMGNTLAASNALYEIYVPVNIATLKTVAEARRKGRAKIREDRS